MENTRLADLAPDALIDAVQTLLSTHTSDQVRQRLRDERVNLDEDTFIHRRDRQADAFTQQYVLKSPFFVIKNLNPPPQQVERDPADPLSGDVSQTARVVLNKFYGYNVTFVPWNDFEQLMERQGIPDGVLPFDNYNDWYGILRNLLSGSETADMGLETGEVQELTMLHSILRPLLGACGFGMKVKNGSDDDVSCISLSTDTDFLFTEGKESSCLPCSLDTNGHSLCSFGFATKVARINWEEPKNNGTPFEEKTDASPKEEKPEWYADASENNGYRENLQTYLGVSGCTRVVTSSVRPSKRTDTILRDYASDPELNAARNFVREAFRAGIIQEHDPVNLWAAVMQACHYSVEKGRPVTIVQSARMWWFVLLGEGGVIHISNAKKVGSTNFLTTVIKFLNHALSTPDMGDRRDWESVLLRADFASATTRPTVPSIDNKRKGDGDGDGGSSKRQCLLSGAGKTASLSPVEQTSREPILVPSVSFGSEESDIELDSCFGYDKFGMSIPWFDQIGDALQILGKGRTGEVTRVIWKGRPVALKTFVLQFDDKRSLQSVYEKELSVLRELEELWGEHVPELLFHKPWPTSPKIGLELGEPLPDDMSNWPDSELEKANETIRKIRELGWEQQDVRGANFVRLKDGQIAMIDFESMKKVLPANRFS